MGCQVEIAETIVEEKADHCLMVKGNQPTLHDGIQAFFADHLADDFARSKVRRFDRHDKGHGRLEERYYFHCPVPKDLPDAGRWKKPKAIGIAISNTTRDGKHGTEVSTTSFNGTSRGRSSARRSAAIGRSRIRCTSNST